MSLLSNERASWTEAEVSRLADPYFSSPKPSIELMAAKLGVRRNLFPQKFSASEWRSRVRRFAGASHATSHSSRGVTATGSAAAARRVSW